MAFNGSKGVFRSIIKSLPLLCSIWTVLSLEAAVPSTLLREQVRWVQVISNAYIFPLSIDGNGNSYVSFEAQDFYARPHDAILWEPNRKTSLGMKGMAKFDAAGNLGWVVPEQGQTSVSGGSLYQVGNRDYGITYLIKRDQESGSEIWRKEATAFRVWFEQVVVGNDDHVYVVGRYAEPMAYQGRTFPRTPNGETFIFFRHAPDGSLVSSNLFPTTFSGSSGNLLKGDGDSFYWIITIDQTIHARKLDPFGKVLWEVLVPTASLAYHGVFLPATGRLYFSNFEVIGNSLRTGMLLGYSTEGERVFERRYNPLRGISSYQLGPDENSILAIESQYLDFGDSTKHGLVLYGVDGEPLDDLRRSADDYRFSQVRQMNGRIVFSGFGNFATAKPLTIGNSSSPAPQGGFAFLGHIFPVPVPPAFVNHPTGATRVEGDTVTLSGSVSGTGLMSFQWLKNDEAIPNQTKQSLTFDFIVAGDAAEYRLRAVNSVGEALSDPAVLTVQAPTQVHVTTVAGNGTAGYRDAALSFDGQIDSPDSVSVAADGTIYFSDVGNNSVRSVSPNMRLERIAGNGSVGYLNASGTNALFSYPRGISVRRTGNILIADTENDVVRQIAAGVSRTVTTLAGSGARGFENGPAANARFAFPTDLAELPDGSVIATELLNHTIRKVGTDGMVSTLAGGGSSGFVDATGAAARFNQPSGIAVAGDVTIYVSDRGNHRIRKIGLGGVVSTVAGTGQPGYRNGASSTAQFNNPNGIAVGSQGELYVCDHFNHVIRRIGTDGVVTTLAGLGTAGFANGNERSALFNAPSGISVHPDGSLIVADSLNHRLRRLTFGTAPVIAPPTVGSLTVSSPHGLTPRAGDRVVLSVQVQSQEPVSYKWFQNNTAIPGGTSAELVIDPASSSDSGVPFHVDVSNSGGTVRGGPISFTVNSDPPVDPPVIEEVTLASSNESAPGVGDRVVFAAQVQRAMPVSYQWYRNNVPIPGASSARYVIESVAASDQGQYLVEAANSGGTVRSAPILLDPLRPPVIKQVTVSTSTGGAPRVGDRVVFSVAAQSETPMGYQWLFNGAPIAGATAVNYEIGSVTLQDQGDYAVDVSNAGGTVRSGNKPLAVLAPPAVQQVTFATPGGGPPKLGDRIVFSAQVQSTLPVTHQWFFNGAAIAGATGAQYTIESATAQHQGSYALEVSSAAGTARSEAAALSLVPPPVILETTFSTSSGSATPGIGERVVFGATIQSSAPVSYRWFFNNAPIPGGTTAGLIIASVALQNQGEYFVEVSNAGGTTRGAPVQLALSIDPPMLSAIGLSSPHGQSPRLGDRIALSVQASSAVPVTYQWFFGNAAIAGANGREHVIAAATRESQGDYYVEAANAGGTARSATLRLTLTIELPVISAIVIASPSGPAPALGEPVTFSIQVTSALPVTYQWFFNGAAIAKATNAQHALAAATPLSQGEYAVEVTNADGTARSAPVQLVIRSGGSGPQVLVTTIAGTNISGRVDATRGAEARFSYPNGLAHFGSGIVAVADGNNNAIRLADRSGQTVTFAGANPPGHLDAAAALAQFNYPLGLRSDRALDLLVADTDNNRIRKVLSFGLRNVQTIAGSGRRGFKNGPAMQAEFDFVNDLVADEQGNIFVIEFNNNAVRKISADGVVSTVAGNGFPSYRDGPGPEARLNQPTGIEIDANGNLYVTEWGNHAVRKITPEGIVSTLAGTNVAGFADGAGAAARFNRPDGITIDPMGNLYVTEHGNHAVRRIDPGGKVVTIAGLGIAGLRDGDRLSAQFNAPGGILWHPDGTLWVSDTDNHALRRIEFLSSTNTGAAELLIALHPALTIFGQPGGSYRIEAAETTSPGVPMEWHAVDTVRLAGEIHHWFDPQPASRKQRVYRAVKIE